MKKILELLKEIRPDSDFENSEDYIEDFLLDSFDIMALVTELEQMYRIKIEISDIIPENFNCISSITSLIKQKGGHIDEE